MALVLVGGQESGDKRPFAFQSVQVVNVTPDPSWRRREDVTSAICR
jgi:hypothetical protein